MSMQAGRGPPEGDVMCAPAQADVLAQQVADLQDEAYAREEVHRERTAALQATVERLSGEDAGAVEARAELERQVSMLLCMCMHANHGCCGGSTADLRVRPMGEHGPPVRALQFVSARMILAVQ